MLLNFYLFMMSMSNSQHSLLSEDEMEQKNRKESNSSCSSSSPCKELVVEEETEIKEEETREKKVSGSKDGSHGGDDDGYHTPTSPRRRIPTVLQCPPAPKKPQPAIHAKRKAERGHARRRTMVEEEIKVFFCDERDEIEPRRKKARAGAIADECVNE